MVKQRVTIKNPTGLHLRPAGILCKEALRYQSSVKFQFGTNRHSQCQERFKCSWGLREKRG